MDGTNWGFILHNEQWNEGYTTTLSGLYNMPDAVHAECTGDLFSGCQQDALGFAFAASPPLFAFGSTDPTLAWSGAITASGPKPAWWAAPTSVLSWN